jgi:hypothetical protein
MGALEVFAVLGVISLVTTIGVFNYKKPVQDQNTTTQSLFGGKRKKKLKTRKMKKNKRKTKRTTI